MRHKHTPGPWYTARPSDFGGLLIKPVPGPVVAQCDLVDEMFANASLIAAAPDMLEALERILVEVKNWNGPYEGAIIQAKKATTKATGGTE